MDARCQGYVAKKEIRTVRGPINREDFYVFI